MAKNSIWQYDTAANNNTDVAGYDMDENNNPDQVNDAFRNLMAHAKALINDISGKLVSGGTGTAYTLTTESEILSYADGIRLAWIVNTDCTGPATLNVNTIGAKALRKDDDQALASGDLQAGMVAEAMYDASANAAAGAWLLTRTYADLSTYLTASSTHTLTNKTFDAAGSGNVLSNVAVSHMAASAICLESEAIASNDVDTMLPTNAAVIDYVNGQQTIWVPAGAMTPNTTNGPSSGSLETATNKVMLKYLAFDSTTREKAQFGIQMPKGWNESTLVAQFVWAHPATVTNFGVSWELAAVAFANDDAADTAFGTLQEIDDTGGTTSDIYITGETPAITVAGSPGDEEYVMFQVSRDPADAGDTMAVDAYLLGVKIHYTTTSPKDD